MKAICTLFTTESKKSSCGFSGLFLYTIYIIEDNRCSMHDLIISDQTSSKNLAPRDDYTLVTPSSNHQPSDQLVQSVGPQEVVCLKTCKNVSCNEFEPADKDNQVKPIYTAVPVNTQQYVGGLYQYLIDCGIEYREETVVSQNSVHVQDVTTVNQQYTQG